MSMSASMSKTSINKQRGLLSLARNRLLDITGKQQQQLQQLQQQHQQQHPQLPEVQHADDELEDIAVVSGAESGQLTYGCGTTTTTTTTAANGPRVVPGIITSSRLMEDRLSSGSRNRSDNPSTLLPGLLETTHSGTTETLLPLTGGTTDNADIAEDLDSSIGHCAAVRNRAFSRHSVFEGVAKPQLNSKRFSPESFSALYVQLADNSHLLDSRKPTGPDKDKVRQKVEHHNGGRDGCNWTFVFDPAGQLSYYWSLVVSLAFLYNFWVLIYRFAFEEINGDSLVLWFCLDYFCDLLYVLDIAFHFRTGYLEEGVLQTDTKKLRHHYLNSTIFYIDSLCLLPLDFMYLSIGFNSMLRCFRLLKIYRFWNFMDRTERHTNYPNLFRTVSLIHYVMVIYHWNACVSHIVMERINYNQLQRVSLFNQTDNRGPLTADNDVVIKYLRSYYWCTLMMTTMGDLPEPQTKDQYLFVTGQLVFGLMLFASVLGHVSSIVINVSAARKEFQAKLDAVKTYMRMRRVPAHLQVKVIKWFDYLWLTHKSSDEEKAVGGLPDKLKAEIAIHVHLDTLKRVEIFQNTEAGFLCELVLRLKPVLFSPGDYICRKGEVGKEMYIVNRGRLQVVADNGRTVLATLKAGSYFGEISILNMGPAGNRRTASVRSVGYSDLFVLSKKDMWDVLKEYPAARVRLEAIAVKRLEKYKKAPLKKAAMGRSRSTPGLIESRGRVPLEQMQLPNNPNWNNKILQQNRQLSVTTPLSRSHGSSSSTEGTSTFTSRRSSVLPPVSIPPAVIERLSPPAKTKPEAPNLRNDLALTDLLTSPWTSVERRSSVQTTFTSAVISAYGAVSGSGVQGRESAGAWLRDAGFLPPEALLSEVNRLRDRLQLLESENLALNSKLRRQQWEVENRLAEIEMQICGAASPVQSPNEDNEQNFESAI